MKRILQCVTVAAFGIVVALVASLCVSERHVRVHQHLEADPALVAQDVSTAIDAEHFSSHLPVLSMDTGGKSIRKDKKNVQVSVAVYDSGGMNRLSDAKTVDTQALVHARGNSSLSFDKSSYALELCNEKGEQQDAKLLGMESDSKWVLNGPFLDKTLIRNYMFMNLSGELMEFAPDVRFCELFLNGKYRGVYVLMERVSRGIGRANVSKINKKLGKTGYIVRVDRDENETKTLVDNFCYYAMKYGEGLHMNIEYPGKSNLTQELKDFITDDISAFEKTLYSYDYTSDQYGYQNTIDVDSFVDYFIINEMTGNEDAGYYSTYLYRDLGGTFHTCVWDFNNSCDNFMERESGWKNFRMLNAPLYNMLTKDRDFTDAVIARYRYLRKNQLSDEALMQYIDDTTAYLGAAIARNYKVWGYSFDAKKRKQDNKLYPDDRNPTDYDEAVAQMKTYLNRRGEWLDEDIDTLRQYSHFSRVKKFND